MVRPAACSSRRPFAKPSNIPCRASTASWWYVFGSAALTVFILQLVTGILLALIYVPSAGEAWSSLQALNHDVTLGWFIRALHGWGSNFMVAIVLIHMMQVFLFGAYKFPRELTWIVGVFLLLMTLGMAFTGQVLRFDQDAYWGLGIGASIASRVPIVGPAIVKLMLGGPIIAGATLSRFFALHVFVIPGMLIGFVGLHLLMVLKLGINEWPMPGRVVKRATYVSEYHELTKKDGAPFVPYAIWKDLFFAAFILLAVAACAFYFGPFGPTGQPDPTIIQTVPKPDYFFLWLYALLSLLPPSLETPALLIGPVLVILGLLLLPVPLRRRRKELAAAAHRGPDRAADRDHSRDLYASRRVRALESAHERLERRSRAGAIPARHDRAGAARRARLSGQAVPQLPFPRRKRRAARSGPGQRCRAAHAGPAHPPGDSGRRQHAGLRQEPESGGDHRARRISPRPCIRRARRPRATLHATWCSETTARKPRRATLGTRSMPHLHHGAMGSSGTSVCLTLVIVS